MEKDNKETIGLRPLLITYLLHWKLIFGVGLLGLVAAILYLVFYPLTYETMARVQIQANTNPLTATGAGLGLGDAAGLMKSFGLGGIPSGSIAIEDEIATFTSNSLLRQTIYQLGLYADYVRPFTFGYRMYTDCPLRMTCDSTELANLEYSIEFTFTAKGKDIKIKAEVEDTKFKQTFAFNTLPAVVKLKEGAFVFHYTEAGLSQPDFRLYVTLNPLTAAAEDLAEELIVEDLSKTSNVIEFTTRDYERQRSKDLFNTLVRLYNRQELGYTVTLGEQSLVFLNDRIYSITNELSEVEKDIERYKTSNRLTNVELDVQYYADYMKELQVKLIEAESQSHLIKMLDAFVKDSTNRYRLAPTLFSSSSASLNGQESDVSPLSSYNQALLERERIINNSGIDNPLVATLSLQIDKLRENVYQMIDNASLSAQLFIDDLHGREQSMLSRMGEVPEQERVYVDFRRQQEILQGVYLLLLQKREEILLSIGQPTDKAKVMDAAFTKPRPVAPRKLFAAIGLVAFTLIVTVGWLFAKEQITGLYHELRKANAAEK